MGVWGVAILSNDIAEDIKFRYKDLLGNGYSNEDASQIIIEENLNELDNEEILIFWLSFALIQWKLGRLQENIKNKALEIIDSGVELENWNEDLKLKKRRETALFKLKQQLILPQPAAKKIPKRFVADTAFKAGDAISYQLASGDYIILKVIDIIEQWTGDRYPLFEICDWYGKVIPSKDEISKLSVKIDIFDEERKRPQKIAVFPHSKMDKAIKKAKLIAENILVSYDNQPPYTLLTWKELDEYIHDIR